MQWFMNMILFKKNYGEREIKGKLTHLKIIHIEVLVSKMSF